MLWRLQARSKARFVAVNFRKEEEKRAMPNDLCWWKSLPVEEECPITLEPLSALSYPPFELPCKQFKLQSNNGSHLPLVASSFYFDGFALASYAVSRGIFQNPLTREPFVMEDCRRLDEYLEEHCTNNDIDNNNNNSNRTACTDIRQESATSASRSRAICVAESFALRESIRVSGRAAAASSPTPHSNEHDRIRIRMARRAEILRSEATAALAGLFVFGSQHHRGSAANQRDQQPQQQQQSQSQYVQARGGGRVVGSNATTYLTVPDFGFDLCRLPLDTATNEMDGLRIIDDDEAAVVASEDQAYRQVQNIFPPLLKQSTTPVFAAIISNSVDEPLNFLESVRTTTKQTEQDQNDKQLMLEAGQQQLVRNALERKELRAKAREGNRQLQLQLEQRQRQENRDTQQARREIEQWRSEHWERLCVLADAPHPDAQPAPPSARTQLVQSDNSKDTSPERITREQQLKQHLELEHKNGRQKIKAAAKRKRAKDRKKALRTEQLDKAKDERKEASIQEQKEQSQVKCASCRDGILDCGFEKLGNKFCSTRCARVGPNTA